MSEEKKNWWEALPGESQQIIWKEMAHEKIYSLRKEQYQNISDSLGEGYDRGDDSLAREPHPQANYARVDQSWKNFWEAENFKRLTLSYRDIHPFAKYLSWDASRFGAPRGHLQSLLKHVTFKVHLRPYDYRSCGRREASKEWRVNCVDFGGDMDYLFRMLSILNMGVDIGTNNPDLTLELEVYSPSDHQHNIVDHRFNDTSFWHNADAPEKTKIGHPHPLTQHPYQFRPKRQKHQQIERVFGRPLGLLWAGDPESQLMPCRAVTKFLIRRQHYRTLDPQSLAKIYRALPGLTTIHHEMWRSRVRRGTHGRWKILTELAQLYAHSLPESVEHLTLFEDKNSYLYSRRNQGPNWPSIAEPLLFISEGLKSLSVTSLIDAADFFACEHASHAAWPSLEYLTLTSRSLGPLTSDRLVESVRNERVNRLLQAAGSAAKRMPKLKTLQLWHGTRRHGLVFSYRPSASSVCRLRGVWKPSLEPRTFRVWEEVSAIHLGADLGRSFNPDDDLSLDQPDTNVFEHLAEPDRVAHQISRAQWLWETKYSSRPHCENDI